MFTIDRVLTNAGSQALEAERRNLRIERSTAFLRRRFPDRIAHLGDGDLAEYTTAHFAGMARGGLVSEQDQLSALAPAIYWGQSWWDDDMPASMLSHGGHWEGPATPRAFLSRCLTGLEIWHKAMCADLGNRNRVATLMQSLYSDQRAIAARGTDPRVWCAEFAPAIWSLMDENARHNHTAQAVRNAARVLPSFQDGILFACIGLVLGVNFAQNPLYPQFARALAGEEPDGASSRPEAGADARRLALGQALVAYWKQIEGEPEQ